MSNRTSAKRTISLSKTVITAVTAATAAVTVAAMTAPAVSASAPLAGSAAPRPPSAKVSVTEAGSTLLEPLFGLWASAYHKQYSNITISPSGGGSGTGISDAANNTIDIGASDAYLSGSEMSEYKGLENVALAISSQMINYNVKGISPSVHLKLNGTVLAEMYQGKVTNWDDSAIAKLNPGVKLPNQTVVPLHRVEGSGDTFLFTTYLSDSDSAWSKSVSYGTTVNWPNVSTALGETGNSGMVDGCKSTPGCVAYIGISYDKETTSAKLGMAQVENRSGQFEVPTSTTISAEASSFTSKTPADEAISMIYGPAKTGYPIINYEYAIVPGKESSGNIASTVKAFLEWAVSPTGGNSAQYLDQVDFQPLPSTIANLSDKLIAKIGG